MKNYSLLTIGGKNMTTPNMNHVVVGFAIRCLLRITKLAVFDKALLIIGIVLLGVTTSGTPVLSQDTNDTSGSNGARPLSPFLTEFPIAGRPTSIEVETSGRVWVTLPELDAITVISVTESSLTAVAYVTQTYQLAEGSHPYSLAIHDTTIWFTANGSNQIGKLDPTTENVQMFEIPEANSGPAGIAVAPDGMVWFTMQTANKLGRLNPETNAFDIYSYPFPNGELDEVKIMRSNSIWFMAPGVNRVVNYDVDRNQFISIPTSPYTRPTGLAVEADDTPWVSITSNNYVGRYAAGTLTFWRWDSLPNPEAEGPYRLVLSNSVNPARLFYVNRFIHRVGVIDIAADTAVRRVREIATPDNCQPVDIAVTGNVEGWFTCGNSVIRWVYPFTYDVYAPVIVR
ncbi:hypothetical protein [Caldilinea sp.]|uniref:Vgb family protein n=1 Tax=Caldilinea sp. TaxID=2293560 RepID=UPI00258D5BF0|nr:hypothetical protein [Caldilinea sp.]